MQVQVPFDRMDRIERFLERRPVKNRRRIKCDGKEFVITKEDVKRIRSYRKNACMDPDVDLYRPLNLSFSRKTMGEGMETRKAVAAPRPAQKRVRKRPCAERKEAVRADKNEIVDLWADEGMEALECYEQDVFVKAGEPYSGPVEQLAYKREDLEKGLRKMYLRLYEPREGKSYKLRDLVGELPKAESLRPFPEEVGLSFGFSEPVRVGISPDFKTFGAGEGRRLGVYEFRGFVKLRHVLFGSEVRKVVFTRAGSVCVLLAGDVICVVDDVFAEAALEGQGPFFREEFPAWSRGQESGASCVCTVIRGQGRINDMDVHSGGRYVSVVCGKKVMVYDLEKRSMAEVRVKGATPLKAKIHESLETMLVSTTNSLVVYDLVSKKVVREAKELSFVLDFCSAKDGVAVVVNNLSKVVLYDLSRGCVLRTMLQEDVGVEVVRHGRYNLMCVVYSKEMVVFYNDMGRGLVVPVRRIAGRFRDVVFDARLPWLYAASGSKLHVFT